LSILDKLYFYKIHKKLKILNKKGVQNKMTNFAVKNKYGFFFQQNIQFYIKIYVIQPGMLKVVVY